MQPAKKAKCEKTVDKYHVYYQGNRHCIYVRKFKNIKKRASEAKTEHLATVMPFDSFFGGMITMETLPSYKDKIFKTSKLLRVFDPNIIKKKDCEVMFDSLKQKILQKLSTGNFSSSDVEVLFHEEANKTTQKLLKISHEPPFTRWLYEYVYRAVSDVFIVESQQENLKDV